LTSVSARILEPPPGACISRHAIITGGSSGIGLATARALAADGTSITLIARGIGNLDAAVKDVAARGIHPGQRVISRQADVSAKNGIERAISSAVTALGPPDLVIMCAGYCRPGRIESLSSEIFEQTNAVNYLGTVHTVLACLPHMYPQRRGHLVLLSSGAGLIGVTGYAAYCPTKFAVRGLAEALRADLKPRGIGVSVVYPPDTDTPQLEFETRFKPPETKAITAAGGLYSPEDVATAILRGIRRNRFAITPGWEMTCLERCASLVRPLLARYFDRIAARVRRA
jgi:3-dehydrosphinganine reductase